MTDFLSRRDRQPLHGWQRQLVRIAKATLLLCAELSVPFGKGTITELPRSLCRTVKEVVHAGETVPISSMSVIKSLLRKCHQEVSSERSASVLPATEGTR